MCNNFQYHYINESKHEREHRNYTLNKEIIFEAELCVDISAQIHRQCFPTREANCDGPIAGGSRRLAV